MSYLTPQQVDTLLKPINPSRVLSRSGMSYLAQHDVRAHMNRIFGFGRWSTDVLETVLLYEDSEERAGGKTYWRVGYRATVKVTVHAPDGTVLAHYTDSHAEESAPQPNRGEAHALALTSVVSYAFKRACTNLGDGFGLSLYNKGQTSSFVKGTLVHPGQDGVAEVEAAPVSEVSHETEVAEAPPSDTSGPVSVDIDWKSVGLNIHALGQIADPIERMKALTEQATYITANGGLDVAIPAKDGTITIGRLLDKALAGEFA
jgi:Rad52/22 family double-strand break repair protein